MKRMVVVGRGLRLWADREQSHHLRMGDDASGWSIDAAALREQDTVITCQVPFDLTVGRYQVTVSNFQGDFASKELLLILVVRWSEKVKSEEWKSPKGTRQKGTLRIFS